MKRDPRPARHSLRRWLGIAAWATLAALPAQAQLGLPRVTLPTLPRELPRPPSADGALGLPAVLPSLRLNAVSDLLREQRDVVEADPRGEPIRRHELLLVSPPRAALDAALAEGFVLLREQRLEPLDITQVVLRAPPGVPTIDALARLRALDPTLEADFNHLFMRSGDAAALPVPRATAAPAPARGGALRRVGLVDSGIDRDHAALRGAQVMRWGCGDAAHPSPHGTAVASLLVGRDARFVGAIVQAALYAADVYCGQPAGGAAENLAAALAWMAREQVAVVNVSLVGPPNLVLERAVQAMNLRGHLIVAAVGNDGPAAAALYPASYAGVVGVTGVAPSRRVLPEAAQGAQVTLAAPGAELAVARLGGGYAVARGTSYAAPLVAGLLAEALRAPDRAGAAAALAGVAAQAMDLGAPGRDPVFGIGLVAEHARVAPDRVRAAAR